jgi:hypothetical protein
VRERNSLVSSNGANRSRRLALKRTKCRVDVPYSTFIPGTYDCFAGARLLHSRCKGTKNDKRGSTCCDRWKWNWGSCCGQVPMTGSCHRTVVGVRFYTNEPLTGYFTNAVAKTRGDPNSRFGCLPARPSRALYGRYRSGLSVPGHALRCGPETSVTSPLRWWELQPICCFCNCLEMSIPSSKRWECGESRRDFHS